MKIFVSSTLEDLKQHRLAVRDAILQSGHHPICMEDWSGEPVEPKIAALGKLAQCDALVGVYAYRYGTIPRSATRSVTEQEFDFACKYGIPCFCFRVDQDFGWLPQFIAEENRRKLEGFLKKTERFLYGRFTTPDSLGKMVVIALKQNLTAESPEPATNASLAYLRKKTQKATKELRAALKIAKELESLYAREYRLNSARRNKKVVSK